MLNFFFPIAYGAETVPIEAEHAASVITYLWWALGAVGLLVYTLSLGFLGWLVLRVIDHEVRLKAQETRCEDYHKK